MRAQDESCNPRASASRSNRRRSASVRRTTMIEVRNSGASFGWRCFLPMIDLLPPPAPSCALAKLPEPYYVCNTPQGQAESEQQMTFDIQNQTRIQELEGQLQAC